MNETIVRTVSTNAIGIITEALRELVPDVGLQVRRSFAFDSHAMDPHEFVQSLGLLSSQGNTPYTSRGVSFLLVPMTAVFTPMSPGECSVVGVLERRLAFLETVVRYTHHFYRETMAKELETAPGRGVDEAAPGLVKRISQLCLQLLDEEAMRECLLGHWLESQHNAAASSRSLHLLSAERVVWTTGLDRYVLSESGLSWERNGRPWFDASHIDGVAHTLSYLPQSQMYALLAADTRGRPEISLVR